MENGKVTKTQSFLLYFYVIYLYRLYSSDSSLKMIYNYYNYNIKYFRFNYNTKNTLHLIFCCKLSHQQNTNPTCIIVSFQTKHS